MSVYTKNEDPDKIGVYEFQFYTFEGTEDDEYRSILRSITLGMMNIDQF